jgi:hypothetical protein
MLSSIEGQRLRADGRPSESEGAWFRRALDTAATLVDLSRYTAAGDASTAVDDLYGEMYVKVRTAVFHAKTGRPVLIPLDAASRPDVMDALKRLGRLFVDLSEKVCGTRYRSGGVFAAGFRLMSEPLVNATRVFLSNDESEFDADARVVSGPGTVHCEIPASRAVDLEEPFFTAAVAEVAADKVAAAVPFVSLAVLAASDTEPLLGHTLEGKLRPEGLTRLSVVIGVRATNTRMLRDRYGG